MPTAERFSSTRNLTPGTLSTLYAINAVGLRGVGLCFWFSVALSGLRGVRGFAVSAFGASRCRPLFLVFGRSVIFQTVANSRSESGYTISLRPKPGVFWPANADDNFLPPPLAVLQTI